MKVIKFTSPYQYNQSPIIPTESKKRILLLGEVDTTANGEDFILYYSDDIIFKIYNGYIQTYKKFENIVEISSDKIEVMTRQEFRKLKINDII